MSIQTVFKTADFTVTVEKITANMDGTPIPVERQEAYFVRHRDHKVVHLICNLYGEAMLMATALQKGTDAVLANPEDPQLGGLLPGGPKAMGRGGLN